MPKMDFGSVILYITFIFLIIVAFLLATTKIINTYQTRRAEASMYSKPTWCEMTTTTTTEETSEEETEDTEDEEDDGE